MKHSRFMHWLRRSIAIMLACIITGILLSAILFMNDQGRKGATASIRLSFEGAANGLAPNGEPYNMDLLLSDDVLNKALVDSEQSDIYTTQQLRENMIVTGTYPPDLLDQIIGFNSVLSFSDTQELTLSDYYPTFFTVTLYNDFDKAIAPAVLTEILKDILNNFLLAFQTQYGMSFELQEMAFDLDDYDYPQQLEILEESINQQLRYASEMSEKVTSFKLNGKGFNDIYVEYNSLKDSLLMHANSMITVYTLSKDPVRLLIQYNNNIIDLKNTLEKRTKEYKLLSALVDSYKKNETIYLSSAGNLTKIDGDSPETYDNLVMRQKSLSEELTQIKNDIKLNQIKIANLTNSNADIYSSDNEGEDTASVPTSSVSTTGSGTEMIEEPSPDGETIEPDITDVKDEIKTLSIEEIEAYYDEKDYNNNKDQITAVESEIAELKSQIEELRNSFAEMLQAYTEQEINEQTVKVVSVRYNISKIFSSSFLKKVIKTAGPIVAIGFIVCMVMLLRMIIAEEKENQKKVNRD